MPRKTKAEYDRTYRLKHGDALRERRRTANQAPLAKKQNQVRLWRFRNIVCEDWDTLYHRYTNTTHCEWCQKEIVLRKDGRRGQKVEHNHYSGEVRGIVCSKCNTKQRFHDKNFRLCLASLPSPLATEASA